VQLLNKLVNDSSSVISDTGLINDYSAYTTSLMGSPNRLLYSRYGVSNTSSLNGSLAFNNFDLSVSTTFQGAETGIWLDDNGNAVTVGQIISPIAMQLNGAFAVTPSVPIEIEGRTSGASTTITNISANTGAVLEVDDNGNSTNFIVGESLNILI
jgi:hypothetical protein